MGLVRVSKAHQQPVLWYEVLVSGAGDFLCPTTPCCAPWFSYPSATDVNISTFTINSVEVPERWELLVSKIIPYTPGLLSSVGDHSENWGIRLNESFGGKFLRITVVNPISRNRLYIIYVMKTWKYDEETNVETRVMCQISIG